MAEAVLLTFLAPSARPLAPQVTALPPLAAYHDVRWLFAFNQSWLGFTGVLLLLVVARSAVDAVLVMLAWPRAAPETSTACLGPGSCFAGVLRGADRAGRAGDVAGGHADVRGGAAAVLLALPGRGAHPARHGRCAQPGRRRPGLVAAASPGRNRGVGHRQLRRAIAVLGPDGAPRHARRGGRGRAGRGRGRAGLVRADHGRGAGRRGEAAVSVAVARRAVADQAGAAAAGPPGCRWRRWRR